MNYAYSALITNTLFRNAKNKITQNVSIFVSMATKQWNHLQFCKKWHFKTKLSPNSTSVYELCIYCLNNQHLF